MSTDYTSDDIEREIERERSELNETLHDLRDRFSIENFGRQLSEEMRAHGGDIGKAVSRTVKENPVGVTLTGIGLAWLAFGGGRDNTPERLPRSGAPDSVTGGLDHVTPVGVTPAGSPAPAPRPVRRYPARPARFSDGTDAHEADGPGLRERAADAGEAAKDSAHAAGDAARDRLHAARDGVSERARRLRDGARGMADEARHRAGLARHRARSSAESLRESIHAGTERLSEEGRARVIAARRRAVEARAAAERAERQVGDAYERQPLVFGALAVAVGAALAGALPRSRFEDQTLGGHSDELFDEAEEIFEAEREKAMAVARATGEEAARIARETRDEVQDALPDGQSLADAARTKARETGDAARARAEEVAERLAETARNEAERQNLGNGKD